MDCPRCDSPNPEGKRFCGDCGAPLARRCDACGGENPPDSRFCAGCGTALAQGGRTDQAATARFAAPASSAERRQLTVLFCDLVGSTGLTARLDPEDLREVIAAYHRCVADVVGRWAGHVAKYMGDGVLAYFGWPQAHEDDAERAVHAGLELASAVANLVLQDDLTLQARIGIATGLVVVGDLIGAGEAQERSVVGETPHLAARLQAIAEPGAVVIGPGTQRRVSGRFDLAELGGQDLKGFDAPVPAWRVLGPSRAAGRFEARQTVGPTPLVGRERELALLLDRWAQARNGKGQVVLICGEPGIGKSRLVRALRERLSRETYTPLHYQCSPYHGSSALYPFIAQLERAAGFRPGDDAAMRLTKLESLLGQGTKDVAAVAPLFADLLTIPVGDRYPPLDLAPQRRKERLFAAMLDQLAGLAARQPVLQLFEDVHWSDPTTLELLGLGIERAQDLSALLLVTFRPEFTPPWADHAHLTRLTVDRLSGRQVAAMVARIAGKPVPAAVTRRIVARTDGVPLFVEELTRTVIESGLLLDKGDRYAPAGPLPALAIPETLQDSLMARLDRAPAAKELAQIAAAIGREFPHALLAAVSALDEDRLRERLTQLISAGLLLRRGTPPTARYAFRHALVQDAAYQSLLKSQRRKLHARIAQVLAERFADLAEIRPELLAHHLTEAGLREQAADYWEKAGQRATDRFANREAIRHFGQALDLLGALPADDIRERRELRLRVALTIPLIALHGFGSAEVERCTRRAKEISERLEVSEHRFTVARAFWNSHLLRGPVPETLALSGELLRLAEATGDAAQLAVAHRARGYALYIAGQPAAARDHLVRGIALADSVHDAARFWIYGEHPAMVCRAYGAQATIELGRVDQGTAMADEAVAIARRLGNPHTLAWALMVAAHARTLLRETGLVRALAEQAIEQSRIYRLPQWLTGATILRGFAMAESGDCERGIAEMELGLSGWHGTGAVLHSTFYHGLLATACCAAGDLDRSRSYLAAAFAHLDGFGERYVEAELRRFEAQLHRAEGVPAEQIAVALRRAMDIAEVQGARLQQLRAATDLARLYCRQGKRREGFELLSPVYSRFTEGFGTLDLRDAKALLDELR